MNKHPIFILRIFFLIILIISSIQLVSALENIGELEWNYRIILVRVTDGHKDVLLQLANQDDEIRERNIYWFVFSNNSVKTNYQGNIQEKFYSSMINNYFINTEENVLLIGKDGEIKQKEKSLDLQSIFTLIDTMPMRQFEMKRNSINDNNKQKQN